MPVLKAREGSLVATVPFHRFLTSWKRKPLKPSGSKILILRRKGKDSMLAMKGQARSFNAVALQSDVLGAERSFKDPRLLKFHAE